MGARPKKVVLRNTGGLCGLTLQAVSMPHAPRPPSHVSTAENVQAQEFGLG